jgi:type I site-specific restriction-modification system R (restriction) subunit
MVWHIQGSGKSLMMVWLAKWIRENTTDARVLIITDRTELDEQIEGVFLGVREEIIDEHLPRWRYHRAELNAAPLAHEKWTY